MPRSTKSGPEPTSSSTQEGTVGAEGRDAPSSGLRARRFVHEGEEYALLVAPIAPSAPPALTLTPAEQEVASLVLRGFSNEEIATMRKSSKRTVANQLQAIYRKLGVASRVELAKAMSR